MIEKIALPVFADYMKHDVNFILHFILNHFKL